MRATKDAAGGRSSTWAFSGTLAILISILFVSVLVAVPPTSISLDMNQEFRNGYSAFVSQGWNFFTKDLQEDQYGVYNVDETSRQAVGLLRTPQTRAENLWGLTRDQRAQGPELANIANAVTGWKKCPTKRGTCLLDLGHSTQVITNTSPLPTICGTVVVTQERQTPWSYRNFATAQSPIIDETAKVTVTCAARGGGR